MKNIQTFLKLTAVAFIVSAFAVGCSDDDNNNSTPRLTGESKTYTLSSVSNPGISGTVKFAERSDNSTLVTIDLDGTTAGNTHPAHIHANSAAETGDIIIDLNAVNGATGMSETIVRELNNGTDVDYDDLLELNGYVNVHLSEASLTTLIAQGDIGDNELTATSKTYTLSEVNDSNITGTVKFTKRASGSTLVTVDLDGTTTGQYPVYIYADDILSSGAVVIDLNAVDGATGMSMTTITELNAGTALSYDQLLTYDGNIRVSASPTSLTTIVSQANIGSNSTP